MKIAIITRSTIEHFTSGGMETHLNNLVTGLSHEDFDITLFTTAHPQSLNKTKVITTGAAKYIYIGKTSPGLNPASIWEKIFIKTKILNRGVNEGSMDFHKAARESFLKAHKDSPFDLVISQSTAGYKLIGLGVPIISIIHGTIWAEVQNRFKANKTVRNWVRFLLIDIPKWKTEYLWANRRFFVAVDKIIAVSDSLKSAFIREHPFAKGKTVVIYNGVDENKFAPGVDKYEDFTLLYIGRMAREKGVDLIIRAVRLLEDENVHVNAKLIGGGIHLEEFKILAEKLKINSKVDFKGPVPNDQLSHYYSKSHVFVLPTRRNEGHPVTLSEAFCSGLPIIATPKGGLKDSIADHTNGLFIREDDLTDLVAQIRFLYENTEVLGEMSRHARERGVSRFSLSAMTREYKKVITSL